MAISKARKDELLVQYKEWLAESDAIFLADYTGMDVKQMQALRGNVREAEGIFSVTKNSLFRLALQQSDWPVPDELLNGQVGGGFAFGEAPTLAKKLIDYAKKDEAFVIKGGIMGGELLTSSQIEALADLPSMDQLHGILLGMINGPARNIAGIVSSGIRQVVNVLDAYANKEEGEAEPATA